MAMLRQNRGLLFCALISYGCFFFNPVFSAEVESVGSTTDLVKIQNYVSTQRHNLAAIYSYADSLSKQRRLDEVVHVYKTALIYYPQNQVLLRKRILAESDLRESSFLHATQTGQTKSVNPTVARALDEIKCRSLRGVDGINACQRLHESEQQIQQTAPEQVRPVVPAEILPKTGHDGHRIDQLASTKKTHNSLPGIDLGNYHALVIGNNRYRHFPKLETAVQDSKTIAALLESQYGYRVTHLQNANRYNIFQELSRLRRELKNDDNLLIYYAGHGYLDESTSRGYWLPIDAESNNYANWLSTNDVTDMLNGMAAKHVLVVADSCYSGTLTRGIQITPSQLEADQLAWIRRINVKKSRTVMASGGLEPVLDSGGGKHSIFAGAFIQALEENKSVVEASRIFTGIRREVILKADQTPEYADIRKAGHEGGDFIFARQSNYQH